MSKLRRRGFIILPLLCACINRDGPVNPRTNEWDSGGDNWKYDALPSIHGHVDSIWSDYDHKTGLGELRLTFRTDDPNLPHDTLRTRIFIETPAGATRWVPLIDDSSSQLTGLEPGIAYRCSLAVTDAWNQSTCETLMVRAPLSLPPQAPEARISCDTGAAHLSWRAVSGAAHYTIYRAADRAGPFLFDTAIDQPSVGSGIKMTVARFDTAFSPRYYIVASSNAAGESRGRDTLYGRRIAPDVPVPVIDAVSKGAYADFVRVEWHCVPRAITGYEIFRSIGDTGDFRLFATTGTTPGVNVLRDSGTADDIRHYRIAAVDTAGRRSAFSAPDSGYIPRDSTVIHLTVAGYPQFLELSWVSNPQAPSYAIYRSSESCTTGAKRLAVLTTRTFRDSVEGAKAYYYHVATIDRSGRESARSQCIPGNLSILSAPQDVVASKPDPATVLLKWAPLPGAGYYIIYRSTTGCPTPADNYDTIVAPAYSDNVSSSGTYYYAIAGLDNAGRTGVTSACVGAGRELLPAPTGLTLSRNNAIVVLAWQNVPGAGGYKVYRTTGECGNSLTPYAVTTVPYFTESVSRASTFSFAVAGIDAKGITGAMSDCRTGKGEQLAAPVNVAASDGLYPDKIIVTWSKVESASGYIVSRGTSSEATAAIGTVTAESFTDTSIHDPAARYYRIAAMEGNATGAQSVADAGTIAFGPVLSASTSQKTVVLTWQHPAASSGYGVYRSSDNAGFELIGTTPGKTFDDNPPGYLGFYYQIRIQLTPDVTANSNTAIGYKAFPPPAGLRAKDHPAGVALAWNRVPGAEKYALYRSAARDGLQLYRVVADTVFFDSLDSRQRYYYRIAASNRDQTGLTSDPVEGGILRTPLPPTLATENSSSAVVLRFGLPATSPPADGYYIYRATASDGIYALIDSTKTAHYNDVTPDLTVYYYRVGAFNNLGMSLRSAIVAGKRIPPPPPLLVMASQGQFARHIKIAWIPEMAEKQYIIYRKDPAGNVAAIGKTADTLFSDSTVAAGSKYIYEVAGVSDLAEGTRTPSNEGWLFGPPQTLTTSSDLSALYISWSFVQFAKVFYVYRAPNAEGPFVLIDTISSREMCDSNELEGWNYYRVAAHYHNETSVMSAVSDRVRREIPSVPERINAAEGEDGHTVVVTWDTSFGADGYRIYRSPSDTFAEDITLIGTLTGDTLIDSVPSDSFYFYKVKAFNTGGESPLSYKSARGFRTPVTAPGMPLDFDTVYTGENVHLVWSMPSRTIAWSGFHIYRSETASGPYGRIDSTSNLRYVDQPASSFPTVYWYKVAAYNNAGEGASTEPIAGTRY